MLGNEETNMVLTRSHALCIIPGGFDPGFNKTYQIGKPKIGIALKGCLEYRVDVLVSVTWIPQLLNVSHVEWTWSHSTQEQ
jgi:hypothetical protein